jgi:hypothetical protein
MRASPQGDRRTKTRRLLLIGVRAVPKEGKPTILGEFVDLSSSGARMILMNPFDVGADVRITLDQSLMDQWIQFDGKIVWREQVETGFAHGVELVNLSAETEELIHELMTPSA